jgi:hypothetical protein
MSSSEYDIVSSSREEAEARMKRASYKKKRLHRIVTAAYHTMRRTESFNSKNYWERRYSEGGFSGAGSYGRLAEYKAEFLNSFARRQNVSSVIEFGSGDGAQLRLLEFQHYIGLDVSKTSIKLCMQQYAGDRSKSFYLYDAEYVSDNHHLFTAELALSLDVIYHLVEDSVFDAYMQALFNAAQKFVIIYASNTSDNVGLQPPHVRHRKFTDWVEQNKKCWTLTEHSVNKYSLKTNELDESFSDFYVYSKNSCTT